MNDIKSFSVTTLGWIDYAYVFENTFGLFWTAKYGRKFKYNHHWI